MTLIQESATRLVDQLRAGDVSAEAVTRAFCDRIEAVDDKVKAFLHYDRDAALDQARAIDKKRQSGASVGRLAGLPIAVKDILCAKGMPTTCASKMLETFVPPYDAHVIGRLREEDAVFLGRVNMDEFAMGSSTENSAVASTRNPWNTDCVPGGSSGGSAAAVAACEAPISLGTDTGGSIRQPASYCGIVGLKPTYGRVSRYGLIAFASSLDQIGPMARTVDDAALLLECIAGHDRHDATSANEPVPEYTKEITAPIKGLKVGIVPDHFGEGLDPEVESAVRASLDVLKDQGAELVEIDLPHKKYGIAAYYLVATAEASSNLARYDGVHYGFRAENFDGLIDMYCKTRGQGFGDEVKRRIMLGTFALSAGYRDAYYIKALQVRRLIKNDFDAAFATVDVICAPTAPTPAFKIGEKTDDPLSMYLSDIYTVSTNLAGICGLNVPCGFSKAGLPIGLQIQSPPFGETVAMRVGRAYQQATDWHTKTPSL
ncbi:Glutamyl-tRNA(Gln) amidotransferase subunit A [Planctomycetes bacterium Pan216]|uniref:Glutamyl-tRNA(Gln) amidotransferase subunit A n=1 Tax=Kolteria novifilia TaxID=2527975 RepID=A0A518B8E5_9BACT|nr:Glutamyl-tRNA(Gln) amidotransferase subunit A [Planctomycetes bacterium Pan216]